MSWIRFSKPTVLWWLLSLIPLVGLYLWATWKRRQSAIRFSQRFQHLTRHVRRDRQQLSVLLLLVAYLTLIFAYSQPQVGQQPEVVKQTGIDILIAIDLSMSMLAQDIKPNRLEHAKQGIRQLLNRLGSDRVGLIAFAGSSYLQCPLTVDYEAVKTFLSALDADTVSRSGTEISRAIQLAIDSFTVQTEISSTDLARAQTKRQKTLIFFTDGEDHSQVAIETAKVAYEEGVRIYCLGVGRAGAGSPIPVYDHKGKFFGYKKDLSDNTVVSKLNEDLLKQIAQLTGGNYYRLSTSTQEIATLHRELSRLEKSEQEEQVYTRYAEQFQWPLAITLICLIYEYLLPITVLSGNKSRGVSRCFPWWRLVNSRWRRWVGRIRPAPRS